MKADDIKAGCVDIARQLVEMRYGDGLEVAMGGGRNRFLPADAVDPEYPDRKGSRKDGKNLIEAWLKRYGDRIVAAHVKDIAGPPTDPEDGWADVGHGKLDWAAIVPALRATKARYWIVEHDKPSDASRFARRSIATFKTWQGR